MAIDIAPLIERIKSDTKVVNEMLYTYDNMDYIDDFESFCDFYDLPFADANVRQGDDQLHAFMLELKEYAT